MSPLSGQPSSSGVFWAADKAVSTGLPYIYALTSWLEELFRISCCSFGARGIVKTTGNWVFLAGLCCFSFYDLRSKIKERTESFFEDAVNFQFMFISFLESRKD